MSAASGELGSLSPVLDDESSQELSALADEEIQLLERPEEVSASEVVSDKMAELARQIRKFGDCHAQHALAQARAREALAALASATCQTRSCMHCVRESVVMTMALTRKQMDGQCCGVRHSLDLSEEAGAPEAGADTVGAAQRLASAATRAAEALGLQAERRAAAGEACCKLVEAERLQSAMLVALRDLFAVATRMQQQQLVCWREQRDSLVRTVLEAGAPSEESSDSDGLGSWDALTSTLGHEGQ